MNTTISYHHTDTLSRGDWLRLGFMLTFAVVVVASLLVSYHLAVGAHDPADLVARMVHAMGDA